MGSAGCRSGVTEPVEDVPIFLYHEGKTIEYTYTDITGQYKFESLSPADLDLKLQVDPTRFQGATTPPSITISTSTIDGNVDGKDFVVTTGQNN